MAIPDRIEPLEVIVKLLIGGSNELLQRIPREGAVLVVDRLDPRAIDRDEFAPEKIETPAQQREFTKHLLERGAIIGTEIRNGLEVGLECPQQADDLDVAVTFGFEPFRSSFDTGDHLRFTFNRTVTFDYFCSLYPQMKGEIVVVPLKLADELTECYGYMMVNFRPLDGLRQ